MLLLLLFILSRKAVDGKIRGGSMTVILLVCRLLNPTCAVLSSLAAALPFEVAIGMNGCVWVNSGSPKHTIVITTAITHAQHVSDDDVPSVVRRLLEHAG